MIDLGGGGDELELTSNSISASTQTTVLGGKGDDLISKYQTQATIDGGAGKDLIRPDDRFSVLALPPEPSRGDVIGGGTGIDTVSYDNALDSISVSLDGKANDGRAGERDDILPSIENILGAQFGGALVGSAAGNEIEGGAGADVLIGAGGRDKMSGASGNDEINALDAAGGDLIDCGDGADLVYADTGDLIASDEAAAGMPCEMVVWAPRIVSADLPRQTDRVTVALRCPGQSRTCRGTLRLTTARAKAKTVARGSYRIRSGKRMTVNLKPSRRVPRKAILFVQPKGAVAPAGQVNDGPRLSAGQIASARRS